MNSSVERPNMNSKWDHRKRKVREFLGQYPNGLSSAGIAEGLKSRGWQPSPGAITNICKRMECVWEKTSPTGPATWRLPRSGDGLLKIKYATSLPGWDNGLLDSEEIQVLTDYFTDRSIPYDRKSKFVDQVLGLFALAVPERSPVSRPAPEKSEPAAPQDPREEIPANMTTWMWVVKVMAHNIDRLEKGAVITTQGLATLVQRNCPDTDRDEILAEIRDAVDLIRGHDFLEFYRGGRIGTKIKRVGRGQVRLE